MVVIVIQDKVGQLRKEQVSSSAVNIILGGWYQHAPGIKGWFPSGQSWLYLWKETGIRLITYTRRN